MLTLMADHDVEGHLDVLLRIWTSDAWSALWQSLRCEIVSFQRLGIADDISDADLWKLCQNEGIVLVTGNRNEESEESLEATIQSLASAGSLPVFTIADPRRIMGDRIYAEAAAERALDFLMDLENLRGTRRLYSP
jgi:hypothetical protein